MKEILRLENIYYSYEKNHPALENITLRVAEGERIALLGNNGAGKSTFFLCCNGILKPDSGNIYLKGQKLTGNRKDTLALHENVGLIFQDSDHQIIGGTVETEISFGPMNLKLAPCEIKERTEKAIADMDLKNLRTRAPQYLSGGEKKRVAIADILAMNPSLLLLDEPASCLDSANTRLLEKNLEKFSLRGFPLIIATHDVDFAWKWAKRILIFHQGRLAADDSPEKIFARKSLLSMCRLAQPLLYQTGELLGLNPLPKTMEELSLHISSSPA